MKHWLFINEMPVIAFREALAIYKVTLGRQQFSNSASAVNNH